MSKSKKGKKDVAQNVDKKEKVEVTEEVVKEVEKNEKENKNEVKKENKKIKEEKKEEKKEKKAEEKLEKAAKKEEKLKEKEEKKEKEEQNKLIKKEMKKTNHDLAIILSIVFGTIILAFAIFGVYFYKSNLEPVVSYEGGYITKAEFTAYYQTFATMLQYYGYSDEEIVDQVAQKAAMDKIVYDEATKAGVTLSDEDSKEIEKIFGDEETVNSFIEQGIDVSLMKQIYEKDYVMRDYLEKLQDEAKDEDVISYIKSMYGDDVSMIEYNTSHILFKTTKTATTDDPSTTYTDEELAEIKAKAEEVLQKALAGEDFGTLAKQYSEDATAEEQGKYLMYDDGNTVEEYEAAVKSLQPGQIYPTLVETDYGYHIIKLISIDENGRKNSTTDREAYVDSVINKLVEEKNIIENKDKLYDLVYKLTGVKVGEEEEEEDTTTDDTQNTENTENSTDTTNTENEAQE